MVAEAPDAEHAGEADLSGEVHTFLIADVRGYTRFTQTRGDEAAGQLAAKFAEVVEVVVGPHQGRLIELRGDEALVVFRSPRQAVRAAVALQAAFVRETLADPSLPLGVGIGIDSGEAVPVQDGYRGGALNLAARLCALASAGQILLSGEAAHLARRIEGLRYDDRGKVALKGIDAPPRVLRAVPEPYDPATSPAFLAVVRPPSSAGPRRWRWIAAADVVVLVASVVGLFTINGSQDHAAREVLRGNAVGRIGAGSGLSSQTSVGSGPAAIASGDGAVWVANTGDATVSRIDPDAPTAPSNTIPIPGPAGGSALPSAITIGAGAVWVADEDNRQVDRIDPTTNRVVASIPVGDGPTGVVVAGNEVWVANSLSDTVSVIDAHTDKVVATTDVGAKPVAVAYGSGSIWVADEESSNVVRINPVSHQPIDSITVGGGPSAVVADSSRVWVANALDGTVSGIDTATGEVVSTVHTGSMPSGVALAGNDLWVTDANGNAVSEIDSAHPTSPRAVVVGSNTAGVTIIDGAAWVSGAGSTASHRGGTFRVEAPMDDALGIGGQLTLDPAFAYRVLGWDLLSVTNDGLVTFRRSAAPTGSDVVPDLASSLPVVSDEGRTYSFVLRRGIRYSTGADVTAADVRASFERMVPNGPPYFDAIAGVPTCVAHPNRHCDLSRGISTDETAGVVTFHLTKPDPDFLFELSLPFADVLPADVSTHDNGLTGLPATGAYRLTSARKLPHGREAIELTRNPRYVEWSGSAQPPGYPDQIDVTLYPPGDGNDRQAVRDVIAGRADWVPNPSDLHQLIGLATTRGGQLRSTESPETDYYFLNPASRPLNDVRVRRAIALGLDRHAALATLGTSFSNRLSCQMIPPTMVGFSPTCPYTTHPNAAGTWTAPDLVAARALVRAAGARNATVRILPEPDKAGPAKVLAATMRRIGLKPQLLPVPTPTSREPAILRYYNEILNPHSRIQAGFDGWYADFPEPSNMIAPLFTCRSEQNDAAFCNHPFDRLVAAAESTQTSNSGATAAAWAKVDAALVNAAPVVPLANPRQFDVLSQRAGNYLNNPALGLLLDQIWVR